MKSTRCLFYRVVVSLILCVILPAHAQTSHERVSHSEGGYRHIKNHGHTEHQHSGHQYRNYKGRYDTHQYRHVSGYRYDPFRWNRHFYPRGYYSSNLSYWQPSGWSLGWGSSWGNDYWRRPYSGIGLSIPFSSDVRKVERTQVIMPVSRVTSSVQYAAGLTQLPANARVINVDGKIQYEWQGKRYRFDWVGQVYRVVE